MNIQPKRYPASRVLLGAFALTAASAYSYLVHAAVTQPPIPRGVAMKSWQENGRDGRYLLRVIEGNTPRAGKAISGIVASDTDCDADAEGLSHCHNIIELHGGGKITVIDTHNMHRYRCMQPGEPISLTGLGKSWILATVSTN